MWKELFSRKKIVRLVWEGFFKLFFKNNGWNLLGKIKGFIKVEMYRVCWVVGSELVF